MVQTLTYNVDVSWAELVDFLSEEYLELLLAALYNYMCAQAKAGRLIAQRIEKMEVVNDREFVRDYMKRVEAQWASEP